MNHTLLDLQRENIHSFQSLSVRAKIILALFNNLVVKFVLNIVFIPQYSEKNDPVLSSRKIRLIKILDLIFLASINWST